ncbi:MAG: J domain-containing protein [Sulfuritalea sp.]|nr:J domain-containing protein [Sulfuritalea sp.]
MSGIEIVVILFGLFLGYWIVSKFLLGGSTAKPSAERAQESQGDTRNVDDVPAAGWNEILHVSRDAPLDEIRQAYKTLIGQYHPDKVASLGEELRALAEHKSKEITQAYREALRVRGGDA